MLGPDTAEELFETTDVVGQTVAYNGFQLEVVGVLESVEAADSNTNDVAIVPLSTYAQRLVGGRTATRSATSTSRRPVTARCRPPTSRRRTCC